MFDVPIAISSWVASTDFPFENALQIAILSINAINGTTISPDPMLESISQNVSSVSGSIENGGNCTLGRPGGIPPISLNGVILAFWNE